MTRLKLMLFLPLAVLAQSPCAAQEAGTATAPQAASGQQGMVVVRDAQTGQLRAPTAAEFRALVPRPSASVTAAAPPRMVVGADGRRTATLDERHMVYSVVTRDGEGKLDKQCVHGAHAAKGKLAQPVLVTQPKEHQHESR